MKKPSLRLALSATVLCALAAGGCDLGGTRQSLPQRPGSLTERALGSAERDVLTGRGFVLSTIEPVSFHQGYVDLYRAHEPVYFTADAVLHALHSSFDAILADVETEVLVKELHAVLGGLREGLAKSTGAPATVRADLDVYLAVAKTLLDGKPAPAVAGGDAAQIKGLASAVEAAGAPIELSLFGVKRPVDVSMMKPRGHYTRSPQLTQYFRAMMWLGTVDIRIGGKEHGQWHVARDALRGAALVTELATPQITAAWRTIDQTTEAFVGPADSMSLPGLSRALATLGHPGTSLDSRTDADILGVLEPEARQRIRGGLIHEGDTAIAFLLFGQRFVADSLVFTKTTYDALPEKRLMPSPLDIGAAVLRNPVAETLLAPELDRYKYRDQLHAAARENDALGPAVWEGNVYHGWLRALSKLSPDPVKDKVLPAVFQTEAWQKRMLSTQLASWAELRHDTVLYAKQSYTVMLGCDYPDGYVDPYPEMWAELARLATRTKALVDRLPFGEKKGVQERIGKHFDHLGTVARRLGAMASLERANQPLGEDDVEFLRGAVAMREENHVCTTVTVPEGWHADLYYNRDEILKREPVVADVHTQPTDLDGNMVGHVLHVGTGHPREITVRIETDTGARVYRGLVASYFETVTRDFQRLNDEEWRDKLVKTPPEDPAWLKDLVAPGALPPPRAPR